MTKVFIDGSAGTTGLQIHQRLALRSDIQLLTLPENLRKDPTARADLLNQADIAFLCLPDQAAIEAAELVENPHTCIIDTSTAHRVAPDWVYGFPELGRAEQIAKAGRIANPGCHATGFISIVYPLVQMGLLPGDAQLSCFSLTGYSGGGKSMIAEYEAAEPAPVLNSPAMYALGQSHKHLPEMQKVCGLSHMPVFCPIVDDYYKGMATTVPLNADLTGGAGAKRLRQALADFYAGQKLISVAAEEDCGGKIYAGQKAGTDSLTLLVCGNEERLTVTALFDNLGKGASGAAIENMNIVLGLAPETGLVP